MRSHRVPSLPGRSSQRRERCASLLHTSRVVSTHNAQQTNESATLAAVSDDPPSGGERAGLPAVGSHIRDRRQSLELSVRELARRVGLSASLISQIERGKATPSVATLYAITNELGLSLDELFSEGAAAAPTPIGAFAAAAGLRELDAQTRGNGAGP